MRGVSSAESGGQRFGEHEVAAHPLVGREAPVELGDDPVDLLRHRRVGGHAETVANQVTVQLGHANTSVRITNAVGLVHVVADLAGYYVDAPTGGGVAAPATYAHIYNLDAQVVALEAGISFSNNGVIAGNITHTPGTSSITLGTAGNYMVSFSVSGVEPGQFALFQNGVPVPGAIYGSGAGTQQNNGQVIVTAAAGDVLTLNNHTSAPAVTLQTLAGGTQVNANASILIEQLGAPASS